MDKRDWIGLISAAALIFSLWLLFTNWYEKKHPPAAPETAAVQPAATQPAVAGPAAPAATNPATTNIASAAPTISATIHAVPATQPSAEPVLLGSATRDDPNYVMQLSLSSQGASVSEIVLNHYNGPDDGKKGRKQPKEVYRYQQPIAGHDGTNVLATRSLVIDGKTVDLWNVPWKLESSDSTSATFSVAIDDEAGNDLLQVIKTYTLSKKTDTGNQGYEVKVSQSIKNLRTDKPVKVHAVVNGPTAPPVEVEQGTDRAVVVGYKDSGKTVSMDTHAESDFKPDAADKDLTSKDSKHFVWAGQASAYFAAIVLPGDDKPGEADLTVHGVALDPGAKPEEDRHLSIVFQTGDITLAPGQQSILPLSVYFGPKWRDVVENSYYAAYPRMYQKLLEIRSMMCGWATSDSLIAGLVWILRMFHIVFRDWGLSIICLVIIVRTLLHPITKRSQVQMMKMGKLAPEVEKLKKKYADQPDVLNREMMKLYKQQGGAILGCLPMFLQTPIWIALWSALQGTFELRQAPFLYGWTWIHDLARPDQLIDITRWFGAPIPLMLFGWHLRAINLLPMLMAVVTYVNQKYFMPVPIAATPEQEQQQKMQRGMSLFFPLMFYAMPSGLNLYYLTSMSLGIVESKIIRDHIKEQEELAKAAGPEIVSMGKPPRGFRDRGPGGAGVPKGPRNPEDDKPGFMGRMMLALQKAQEQAEQIRKDKDKGKAK